MSELGRPFVQLWDYAGRVGGFPGQAFFCVAVVMLIIALLTWFGNKK